MRLEELTHQRPKDRWCVRDKKSAIRFRDARSVAASIDYCNASNLGFDHKPLEHAIAGECDHVTGVKSEHLVVTLEAGAGTKPPVEGEYDLLDLVPLGPARCEPVDTLAVATMCEEHVRDSVAHLVQRCPDVRRKGFGLVASGKGTSATGEDDWCAFGSSGCTVTFGTTLEKIAGIDDRRCEIGRVVRTRAGHGAPGSPNLIEIEGSRGLAHLLERDYAGLGCLRALNLFLEIARMNFRSIGASKQCANFVTGPVELGRLAVGRAMEEIDEAPGNILCIGFKGGVGKHRE